MCAKRKKTMRIAVCDDVKNERMNIILKLEKIIKGCEVTEFDNGEELVKSHRNFAFDLIILDIIMPHITGIDTAALIRKTDTSTPIVFISSSEEFGVQSYRVLAFDYLLKPVDENLLKECICRLLCREENKQCISVNYCGVETKILLSNIQCLESNLRKVIFTLSENREIAVNGKLTDYEDYLIANGFCRCHKSYLVNIRHIDCIDGDAFHLTGKKQIKISRSYLQSAKKAYFDYVFSAKGGEA